MKGYNYVPIFQSTSWDEEMKAVDNSKKLRRFRTKKQLFLQSRQRLQKRRLSVHTKLIDMVISDREVVRPHSFDGVVLPDGWISHQARVRAAGRLSPRTFPEARCLTESGYYAKTYFVRIPTINDANDDISDITTEADLHLALEDSKNNPVGSVDSFEPILHFHKATLFGTSFTLLAINTTDTKSDLFYV